jgi:hypothetical protein
MFLAVFLARGEKMSLTVAVLGFSLLIAMLVVRLVTSAMVPGGPSHCTEDFRRISRPKSRATNSPVPRPRRRWPWA